MLDGRGKCRQAERNKRRPCQPVRPFGRWRYHTYPIFSPDDFMLRTFRWVTRNKVFSETLCRVPRSSTLPSVFDTFAFLFSHYSPIIL